MFFGSANKNEKKKLESHTKIFFYVPHWAHLAVQ